MRILFINHVFPGIFGPLAAALASDPGNDVIFASIHSKRDFAIPGVRHMVLPPVRGDRAGRAGKNAFNDAGMALTLALQTGRQALQAFRRLRESGFVPDMVLSFAGEASALFWQEAFPRAFRVCWSDGEPAQPGRTAQGAGLARHLLHCRQALDSDLCVSLTAGQPSLTGLRLTGGADLPHAVDTVFFCPGAATPPEALCAGTAVEECVLFCVGSHSLASAGLPDRLAALLEARPHCHIFLLCGSLTPAPLWAEACAALPHRERLHLPGGLSLAEYRALLRTARLVVFPHRGDVPPAPLLEAMSCGTAVLLPADMPPSPLLRPGRDMLLAQGPHPEAALLAQAPLLEAVGKHARQTVLASFDRKIVLPQHVRLLRQAHAAWQREQGQAAPAAPHDDAE